jgi:hypothetical protein
MSGNSEATGGILFSGEFVVRADGNKIHVEALVSVPKVSAEPLASKVLKIYAPALLVRIVGRKVVLSAGRTLADTRDVLSDFERQIGDVMTIPGVVVIDLAGHRAGDRDVPHNKEQTDAFHDAKAYTSMLTSTLQPAWRGSAAGYSASWV